MQIIDALEEEGRQQLFSYLEEFVMTAEWMPAVFEQQKKWMEMSTGAKTEQQKTTKEIVKKLSVNVNAMRDEQKLYRRFCETVEHRNSEL